MARSVTVSEGRRRGSTVNKPKSGEGTVDHAEVRKKVVQVVDGNNFRLNSGGKAVFAE